MHTFPYPLGATPTPSGVNFSVYAPHATSVRICIAKGTPPRTPHNCHDHHHWQEYELTQKTYGIWHDIINQAHIGDYYGIRADGPWLPRQGWHFNPHKFLLDPYARAITGSIGNYSHLSPYHEHPLSTMSTIDSCNDMVYGVITTPKKHTSTDPLFIPWQSTIIYEAHLGSLTAKNPKIPRNLRGTYLGAAHPATIDHLLSLGITTIEFLPLQTCIDEPILHLRNKTNNWGYSTAGFFAPDPRYAASAGNEIAECAQMIDTLHDNGIEVILDVVYNHSCEGLITGGTISWRGLGAKDYYLIDPDGGFVDYSGVGNTFNASSPPVTLMILDSLRYWAENFSIDGFRFDLAPILGRGSLPNLPDNPDNPYIGSPFWDNAPTLAAIASDPILRTRKLIAEPWDATAQGYSLGKFSALWSEWNDNFRDIARKFWLRQEPTTRLATRISASEDIFAHKRPQASINFITAHDGFTLRDLVSYEHKHNDANGENNSDGSNNNYSTNHGVEGDTNDSAIILARATHQRNLLATVLLSAGVPMLLAGDEIGHSNQGNNNPYCVEKTPEARSRYALDWENTDRELLEFTQNLVKLRTSIPSLMTTSFYHGYESGIHADVLWYSMDGTILRDNQWEATPGTLLAYLRNHSNPTESVIILYHNLSQKTSITLPDLSETDFAHVHSWMCIFDTRIPSGIPQKNCNQKSLQPFSVSQPCVLVYQQTHHHK